jgi:hypothetical protein
MSVTHIEEKQPDLMQTMVHDQFAKQFDPQRAIQSVAAISDAMFKVGLAKPTIAETIELAVKLEKSIDSISKRYTDHRGNLEESMRCVADIISNLEGQQRFVVEGE